jgi:hypothetical protein
VPLAVPAFEGGGPVIAKAGDAVVCEGVRRQAKPFDGLRVGLSVREKDNDVIFVVSALAVPPRGAALAAVYDPAGNDVLIRQVVCLKLEDVAVGKVDESRRASGVASLIARFNRPASAPGSSASTSVSRAREADPA